MITNHKNNTLKKALLFIMAALYIAAGINHFVHPATYVKIMPPWLPEPGLLVCVSGVLEVILGMLLIPVASRRLAAWGIIVLLIAVFPANVQMMLNYRDEGNPQLWITVLRLPLQVLLIYWAYGYAKTK